MTMPMPEKASFNNFSEIWPNAWPAERMTPDQSPAATKLKMPEMWAKIGVTFRRQIQQHRECRADSDGTV
jgi:hypothetical protein